jgi:hypothetical protein
LNAARLRGPLCRVVQARPRRIVLRAATRGATQARLEMAAPNRLARRLYESVCFRVREMMSRDLCSIGR